MLPLHRLSRPTRIANRLPSCSLAPSSSPGDGGRCALRRRTLEANREAEAAIRANVDAFVQAYNQGNAQTIANLFTPEGQLIDENDHTTHGHDAIEHAFADVFKAAPAGRIEVNVDSVRFFGSALAVETGTTKVVDKPGAEPRRDALHRGAYQIARGQVAHGVCPRYVGLDGRECIPV